MKKLLTVLVTLSLVFLLGACASEQGDYEPGVYFGYTDGHQNTFAVVTIDENGFISQIFVDTVYMKADPEGPATWTSRGNEVTGYATTKMSLDGGCGYNMWPAKPVVDCKVEGEIMWHDQVSMVIEAVIA
ncbi:hypothetical protein, partial [Liberiplasma polymorphum]|uniref:hypothetical protein n=1 Tax=Liberiplasma polymorphum TaxID=3374570 RepID=UPI003776A5A3